MSRAEPELAVKKTDLLVIGLGLAGMRAATAALERLPGIRVLLAGPADCPSGSSFANQNKMLGMQLLDSPEFQRAFVARALEIARPGRIDPNLVRILAEESAARYEDLRSLGVEFMTDRQGNTARFPGCFLPGQRSAVVLTSLGRVYHSFRQKILSLGGEIMSGYLCAKLPTMQGRVLGGLFEPVRPGEGRTLVLARGVVAAMGGPAPLFADHAAGPDNPGFSYGLLKQAGADLANAGFLQFMWFRQGDNRFFQPGDLARPGTMVRDARGREEGIDPDLAALAPARREHCPISHGFADNRLDRFLLERADEKGRVHLRPGGQTEWIAIIPKAQAGNGGAVIDEWGQTSAPGLYACGECAAGMHGADRIGGGMVLATQVFGRRAGIRAAEHAARQGAADGPGEKEIAGLLQGECFGPAETSRDNDFDLGGMLRENAIFSGPERLYRLAVLLAEKLDSGPGWLDRLRIESALEMVKSMRAAGEAAQTGEPL